MSRRSGWRSWWRAWLPVASACAAHPRVTGRPDRDCITDFRPGTDYFPDKSTVLDATNFTLSYHDSYQVLTVKQPYPHGQPESYVLVRCGAPAPRLTGDLAGAQRITIPVTSMYSASITQLGMIAELDRADVVTGVAEHRRRRRSATATTISTGQTVGYAPGHAVNVGKRPRRPSRCVGDCRAPTTPATRNCATAASAWSLTPNGWKPPRWAGPNGSRRWPHLPERRRRPPRCTANYAGDYAAAAQRSAGARPGRRAARNDVPGHLDSCPPAATTPAG